MKKILLAIIFLLPVVVFSQIPNINPRNIKILYQTSGKGTVWHGGDTINYTPVSDGNAWLHLDTINNRLYSYVQNQWKLITASGSGGGSGVQDFYTSGDTLFLETTDTTFYVITPQQNLSVENVTTNKVKIDISGSSEDIFIKGEDYITVEKSQDTVVLKSVTSVSITELDLGTPATIVDDQGRGLWDGLSTVVALTGGNKKRIILTINGQTATFDVCKCE